MMILKVYKYHERIKKEEVIEYWVELLFLLHASMSNSRPNNASSKNTFTKPLPCNELGSLRNRGGVPVLGEGA